jgi:hypothetical protein
LVCRQDKQGASCSKAPPTVVGRPLAAAPLAALLLPRGPVVAGLCLAARAGACEAVHGAALLLPLLVAPAQREVALSHLCA